MYTFVGPSRLVRRSECGGVISTHNMLVQCAGVKSHNVGVCEVSLGIEPLRSGVGSRETAFLPSRQERVPSMYPPAINLICLHLLAT